MPQPLSASSTTQDPVTAPAATQDLISNQAKLALFESVLAETEAEAVSPPAAPAYPAAGHAKERLEVSATPVASAELPGGMQYVETEPTPELSPEVSEYLQRVEENPMKLPQEIVVAAQAQHAAEPSAPQQSVKVLPLTKDQAEAGAKKNTSFSIRWLVEFSHKIAAMFSGKAVYRSE